MRRPEKSYRYWVNLEASMCFGMPISTTDSLLSLMTMMKNGPVREKGALEIGGLEFPLDLTHIFKVLPFNGNFPP